MSLFSELKRRNVFRVAIAYLASAWLLIEVAGTLFPAFGIPDWALRFTVMVLALGLVPTLILSWAYELTPDGLKREKEVVHDKSTKQVTAGRLNAITIGLIILAVAFILVDRFWLDKTGESSTPSELVDSDQPKGPAPGVTDLPQNSIAVLPFVNMSDDAANEYFSDGISEEILNTLAQVKQLKVVGHTSSFAFKGRNEDLRKIAAVLSVGHILEGSVRKSGNTVRITAQLIQASDGYHLWSQSYDRELKDIFAIQDEIAADVMQELKSKLLGDYPQSAPTARTKSSVYDLYLQARQLTKQRNQEALELAVGHLENAIAIDPEYAPAHALLGIATMLLAENFGTLPEIQAEENGLKHIQKALQLDPELPEAMAGMGYYYSTQGLTELDNSIYWLRKSLAINPNLPDANTWLAQALSIKGEYKEPIQILENLFQRDPLYGPGLTNLIKRYVLTGQSDRAFKALEDLRPFLQSDPNWLSNLGFVQLFNGQWAEANRNLRASLKTAPELSQTEHWLSQLFTETAQYEDCGTYGADHICTLALSRAGHPEQARLIGERAVMQGRYPCWFFWALLENGEHAYLIDFVESNWKDLEEFEKEYQDNAGWGSHAMASIADAYAKLGKKDKHADALSRAEASNNKQIEQGADNGWLNYTSAHIAVLRGDFDSAIAHLEKGLQQGFPLNITASTSWPAFKIMEGNPRYDNFKMQMMEAINAERVKMGIGPLRDTGVNKQ